MLPSRNSLGSPPDAFLTYFTSKFPKVNNIQICLNIQRLFQLLLHTFLAMTCFAEESIFKSYYPTEIKSLAERMWDDALKQVHPQFRTPPRIPTNGASNLVKSSLNADVCMKWYYARTELDPNFWGVGILCFSFCL